MIDALLRRVGLRKGHLDPVPTGDFRLVRLTDSLPFEYIGDRDWCDAVLRPCACRSGRCCDCAHSDQP